MNKTEEARKKVCDEVLKISATYDEQYEAGDVGTPGGLEHMGDVWRLFAGWARILKDANVGGQ